MLIKKPMIFAILIWLLGMVALSFSVLSVISLLFGAALGPIESNWFIAPLAGGFIGAILVFYAYRKAVFFRQWVRKVVLVIFILPFCSLGLLSGFLAIYTAALPFFEETKIIKRDVLFESGWHFVNSNSYFGIRTKKLHQCITRLGTKRLVATLEVTLNYGKVSYFRVLKFGECKVESPSKNPNHIVPPYTRGEENNNYT